jgi:hypothetical protein
VAADKTPEIDRARPTRSPTAADFTRECRALVGRPYIRYGRTIEGLDCVGVILFVGKKLGLIPPGFKVSFYTEPPDPVMFTELLPPFCDRVELKDLREADILLLASEPQASDPHHMMVAARSLTADRWSAIGADISPVAPRITEIRMYAQRLDAMVRSVYRFRDLAP